MTASFGIYTRAHGDERDEARGPDGGQRTQGMSTTGAYGRYTDGAAGGGTANTLDRLGPVVRGWSFSGGSLRSHPFAADHAPSPSDHFRFSDRPYRPDGTRARRKPK